MTDSGSRIVTTRKLRMGVESDRADREFWAAMSAEQRVEQAWRLSIELWEIMGWDADEPGLCRAVARTVSR
jgi:hypothetical protein